MFKYRNKVTGKTVLVSSKIGGDWELVSESSPTLEVEETKPVEVEKSKKKTTKKK